MEFDTPLSQVTQVNQPRIAAGTNIGTCEWELPSVARAVTPQQSVYGTLYAPCGGNTAQNSTKPLNTYWRSDYYNTGCSQPPTMMQWSDAGLNGLFKTTDPFQTRNIPRGCMTYGN